MRIAALILVALALAGCTTTAPIVPAQLLSCAPQPASPAGNATATQRDASLFIVDLASAGDDCRTKLGSVRRILTETD